MPVPALDALMEDASLALGRMDYLACVQFCTRALELARRERRWSEYARILLPLQEARRQRRMRAVEGAIRLGTTASLTPADLPPPPASYALVLTHPLTRSDAQRLWAHLASDPREGIILWAESPADAPVWTISTLSGPVASCERPAPPAAWRDQWLSGSASAPLAGTSATPADWVLDAGEALGDAVLATLDPQVSGPELLAALENCLRAAPDHEIIHQRLGSVARALARA